jgi:ubiquinone/menaquinone biosynthesis C-methylase UbiE
VQAPHPFITRARLREALQPQPGERVLEIGPGTGYYSLDLARWLEPGGGALEIFDLQQEMLDHTIRRAGEEGVANISAVQGDAQRLPFEEGRFDAAVLTAVLGEIPDQDAALREVARVLKPHGRLVVGELFGDPHWVTPNALRRRAEAAGLTFEHRLGPALGCFSVFAKSG